MHFLTPLILALSLASASNATFSLFTRQTQICFVVPITATDINGYTLCGDGSVLTGCTCCPDLVTPCSATQQTCQLDSAGGYLCVDDPALAFTNCATQGLCPSTEQCCTLSDGSVGCCPLGGNGGGSAATTTAYSSSPSDSSSPTSITPEGVQPTTLTPVTTSLDSAGTSAPTSASGSGSAATTPASNNARSTPNTSSKLAFFLVLRGAIPLFAAVFGL